MSKSLLYKYYGPDRLSVLTDLLIRFTPLTELNDPHDGRFILEPMERERAAAEADGYNAEWAQVEVFIHMTMGALGVLCLSKVPDSEPMWSHYTAGHRGFIIGINRDCRPFDGAAFIWDDYRNKIDLTSIPGFGSFRDVDYEHGPYQISFGGDVPFDAFFSKKPSWSYYEEEVRIFRSVYDAKRVDENGGAKIHLFEIPPHALARVIVGANASKSIVETALALASRPGLGYVSVERAVINNRAQRIMFKPIDAAI